MLRRPRWIVALLLYIGMHTDTRGLDDGWSTGDSETGHTLIQHHKAGKGDDGLGDLQAIGPHPAVDALHHRMGFRRHRQITDERDLDDGKQQEYEDHKRTELGTDSGSRGTDHGHYYPALVRRK